MTIQVENLPNQNTTKIEWYDIELTYLTLINSTACKMVKYNSRWYIRNFQANST
jgi:hypothetical protein